MFCTGSSTEQCIRRYGTTVFIYNSTCAYSLQELLPGKDQILAIILFCFSFFFFEKLCSVLCQLQVGEA